MAAATQLMPNAAQQQSAFSPYTDSPSSPAPFSPHFRNSNRSSAAQTPSDSLQPPSPYPAVEPSPVDSNGTNTTDIDDESQADDDDDDDDPPSSDADALSDARSPTMSDLQSPASPDGQTAPSSALPQLDTSVRARSNSDDQPQSVIHAPPGYQHFTAQSPADTENSANTVVSPDQSKSEDRAPPRHADDAHDEHDPAASEPPPTLDTSVPGKHDRTTPRAQTRQEAEEERRRRSRPNSRLEDIAESDAQSEQDTELSDGDDTDADHAQTMGQALEDLNQAEQEIQALKTALSECWTLCNTLAGLSSIHRERMFTFSGQGDQGEQAWKSCWRLCQKLYESREEGSTGEVRPTLELCRDFCQALFEARHRVDEASDSVLRVSFELNNHLYNTADRNLPEAFRERTLDFYITLCHRLMKQRTSLPQETDSLLRACWSLAEMLFSLRQNTRDGKPPDEELLGSAVQACWELCDLFREGWTQVRPDRGTPRPSQSTFPAPSYSNGHAQSQRGRSVAESERSLDLSFHSAKSLPPETPTTIFDDIAESSPDEPNVPNILVLGPENNTTRTHNRWSSSASTLSGYTDTSSQRTSSTATAGREDPHLMRLKTLILRAAMNVGYTRATTMTLPAFVKALPSNSFGSQPWQTELLLSYKRLVLADPTLRVPAAQLPARRLGAAEVARAVQWMSRAEQFSWFRDLYRLVFGFFPEDSVQRGNAVIQT
ncbi:hypothetical protein B0J12DRAFT_734906 [Macrophomina phaseolina]|uniref:DUF7624 domain-containing protein n=1 Tax=Macrophomina phaseolina TaxID=35725 RepID=A0ABQ8GWG5_9PEZI|nr:hypothetical protein B0J12DRAFT_734906 [Macrophomina phaseolina]